MIAFIDCYNGSRQTRRLCIEADTIEEAEKRFLESDSFLHSEEKVSRIEIELIARKIKYL
jgi:hypothetical protein